MEEFFNKYYAIINFTVVFFPAIVGLFLYKKYKNTLVKLFIWFCFYVAFVEIIGAYGVYIDKFESLQFLEEFIRGSLFENSKWWYLIFWTFGSALFYAYYFWRLLNSLLLKRVIKYSAILYVLFFVVFFVEGYNEISTSDQIPIDIAKAFIIAVSVFAYFFEILKSNKILSIFSSMHFYIGATILLWHLLMTPLAFYDIYFNSSDMDYAIMKAIIFLVCNALMYLTFSFALIWCKPQNN